MTLFERAKEAARRIDDILRSEQFSDQTRWRLKEARLLLPKRRNNPGGGRRPKPKPDINSGHAGT